MIACGISRILPLRNGCAALRRAERLAEAIGYLMWDAQDGVFTDYLWYSGKLTDNITAATL
jgi:neutral trehalase